MNHSDKPEIRYTEQILTDDVLNALIRLSEDWEKENCDSIIQSYITSFDDSLAFIRALEEKGIDLRFTDE